MHLKFTLLVVISFISFSSFSQSKIDYRSSKNPFYWKNKKPYQDYWQQDVKYKIKAEVDDSLDVINGTEFDLKYYNNSPDTLHELFFHLYENAFQPGSYYDNLSKANHVKPTFGKYESQKLGTTIDNFKVNNKEVKIEFDNTIFKVFLSQPLLPNDSLTVTCSFKTYFDTGSMRRRNKIFTENGIKHFDGVHWYPIICVYDHKFGWTTDQHLDKEFYANFGSFDLELTFPSHYIVESTGQLLNEDEVMNDSLKKKLHISNFKDPIKNKKNPPVIAIEKGKTKTWKYFAFNVHNVAFTADPRYRIDEIQGNGYKVIALVQEQNCAKWIPSADYTKKVMQVYEQDFGAYIWPKIIVADADDGMEYPMLTLDGGTFPQHKYLLAHELGHMWFYGMLGSNETYRAFMDEGFTQFLTVWSMDKIDPQARLGVANNWYTRLFSDSISNKYEKLYMPYLINSARGFDANLNTHSSDFNGALRHGGGYGHVYYKTGTMLYNLREVLGDTLFQNAMKYYVQKWKVAHPYPEDFKQAIIEYTHVDLNWFFDQWLETQKQIDYKIKKVKRNGNTRSLVLERVGEGQMPIKLTIDLKNGEKRDFVIPNTWFVPKTKASILPKWYGWGLLQQKYEAQLNIDQKIVDAHIDPSLALADIDLRNNHLKNSTKWIFDSRVPNLPNWKHSTWFYRPDIWWNSFDGMQIGLHAHKNYFEKQNIWDLNVWYNSKIGQTFKGDFNDKDLNPDINSNNIYHDRINFSFSNINYLNKIYPKLTNHNRFQYLAGVALIDIGFEQILKRQDMRSGNYSQFSAYYKMMGRNEGSYLYNKNMWNESSVSAKNNSNNFYDYFASDINYNNSFIFSYEKFYVRSSSRGNIKLTNRTFLNSSGYNQGVTTNIFNLNKLELRTRALLRLAYPNNNNTFNESKLYLSGASPEEMLESKYYRSRGFFDNGLYQTSTNQTSHMQMGGGLNVRGFSGLATAIKDINGVNRNFLIADNSGASANFELDFDQLFKFKKTKFNKNLHFDTYLFHDMGVLGNSYWEFGRLYTSSGLGIASTFKFSNLNIEPLTIRVDFPILNNIQLANENKFSQRFVIGINRAF